jgi:hypothetical protein
MIDNLPVENHRHMGSHETNGAPDRWTQWAPPPALRCFQLPLSGLVSCWWHTAQPQPRAGLAAAGRASRIEHSSGVVASNVLRSRSRSRSRHTTAGGAADLQLIRRGAGGRGRVAVRSAHHALS